MFTFKRKIVRAIAGAAAVTALSLSAFAGAIPAAHADSGGVYPPNIYGPGGSDNYGQRGNWQFGGGGLEGQSVYISTVYNHLQTAIAGWNGVQLTPKMQYDVCAYIPNVGADATGALYSVKDADGFHEPRTVNQDDYTNEWAYVGRYYPNNNGVIVVNLSNESDLDQYGAVVGADAMMFIPSANDDVEDNNNGVPACYP